MVLRRESLEAYFPICNIGCNIKARDFDPILGPKEFFNLADPFLGNLLAPRFHSAEEWCTDVKLARHLQQGHIRVYTSLSNQPSKFGCAHMPLLVGLPQALCMYLSTH
ncbi:hypothetical protein CBM2629_A10106 [Cupriavidus taiwanensis]|nr:hypothetical protein CBM2629_A10106 [Cupriavidus taiwanensis]